MIGEHLITAGYTDSVGRYRIGDMSHANSFDSLFATLEREFALHIHEEPLTTKNLSGADIVMMLNPENPEQSPGVPVLSDEEIAALDAFIRAGGSLLVTLNNGGVHVTLPSMKKEGGPPKPPANIERFETAQLGKLLTRFGVMWNDDDTHYSNIPVGPAHDYFYDIDVFHYGGGCTLRFLPHAQQPTVLLAVKEDAGFPATRGPGIAMVRHGKGKVCVMGDTGSWGGGNLSRPWAENSKLALQLFRHLKPDQGVASPKYSPDKNTEYRVTYSQLNVLPVNHPLVGIAQPGFRFFTPRPETKIPYAEGSGRLVVHCVEVAPGGTVSVAAAFPEFRTFDQPIADLGAQKLTLRLSRQGNVAQLDASGAFAQFMSPDIAAIVAFVPHDGIRIGDRWTKTEQARIIPIRGADLPATRPVDLEMIYVRDETVGGRACRLIRSQAEVWLSDIGVGPEELVPLELRRGWQAARFETYTKRAGKLLISREQWLDRETSIVVKAHTQSRIVAWLRPADAPIASTNAERDYAMASLMAHIVTFEMSERKN